MKRVTLADLPWDHWVSPAATFEGFGQQVSCALGAADEAPAHLGGHPFDLEHGKLPPGKSGCPFHTHGAQWELFVILSGEGTVRHGAQRTAVRAGHVILHPPGEAHQLINTGATDLTYFLVADNPPTEWCYYPDSDKWGIANLGTFTRELTGYYVGEEEGAPTEPTRRPPPPVAPEPPLTRILHLDDIPWQERTSPQGKFGAAVRLVSMALGCPPNQNANHGGHPFDLTYIRVPAGKAICPYHQHSRQSEMFIVLEGRATIRTADGSTDVPAGDIVFHPPGTAHQTSNTSDDDLLLLVIANNPSGDTFYYPDSDKHGARALGKFYRITEVNYFDGEE
ncbi:cupin domain-containing protein [Actomonas aquatica]|uniref:Cupin domain-containing protein n=1 Tax=Actomonas aquatica TaxID=2866162 RepID=A0ABZ1C523_9BACT|nr:cupin domain-containing protein [Opitutus sp. WL0086]WRQ86755.1 cupin domain-containing protein [Opitutus sp. WL0086]